MADAGFSFFVGIPFRVEPVPFCCASTTLFDSRVLNVCVVLFALWGADRVGLRAAVSALPTTDASYYASGSGDLKTAAAGAAASAAVVLSVGSSFGTAAESKYASDSKGDSKSGGGATSTSISTSSSSGGGGSGQSVAHPGLNAAQCAWLGTALAFVTAALAENPAAEVLRAFTTTSDGNQFSPMRLHSVSVPVGLSSHHVYVWALRCDVLDPVAQPDGWVVVHRAPVQQVAYFWKSPSKLKPICCSVHVHLGVVTLYRLRCTDALAWAGSGLLSPFCVVLARLWLVA